MSTVTFDEVRDALVHEIVVASNAYVLLTNFVFPGGKQQLLSGHYPCRADFSHFSLPREGELQDAGLDGTTDPKHGSRAPVAPVHIGDERADPAALAQHQEMIEERAA